uniref:Nodulation-signaling pathway 2 protein n=2 Tax=Cajanus cajan TaxID=3821 RepID=A0A151RU91_CAJCA|nr:Nodulation-signaling pathway 2 protein [Cajanus cajan]
MHPEILESPSCSSSFYQANTSTIDLQFEHHGFLVDPSEFNSLFNTLEDTSSEASSLSLPSIMFTNDNFVHYPIEKDIFQLPTLMDEYDYDLSMDFDEFDHMLRDDHHKSEVEDTTITWSPTSSLNSDLSSNQKPLTLPHQGMEIENQVSLPHMLEALGEAIFQGEKPLAKVIMRCIMQKVSPISEPLERLAFYLCQDMMKTSQGDCCYLTQEASKNFEATFKAFYQGLPHGKFAHFVANLAIIEALPHDCEVIHIVDFDMGEGSQWPPLIEAIATLHKTLKLTSIKWGEESSEGVCVSSPWRFEGIRRDLYEHARSCGVKLVVEGKGIEEVVSELKKMNKRGGRREFLAFNCMVDLPHMGRGRSRKHVMEFLDLIKSCGCKGVVTFGDGRVCEELENDDLEFRSFFERHLVHYKALLESVESHFPNQFLDARTAMECLFVAPYVSSLAWLQKWEEIIEDSYFKTEIGLEGCGLSNAILMEVKEMLNGCEEGLLYQARIEGKNCDNQLILEWKGIQLVRVSIWRN